MAKGKKEIGLNQILTERGKVIIISVQEALGLTSVRVRG